MGLRNFTQPFVTIADFAWIGNSDNKTAESRTRKCPQAAIVDRMDEQDLQEYVDVIGLLQAMYPLPEELVLSPETAAYMEDPSSSKLRTLDAVLSLPLDSDPSRTLELAISLSPSDGSATISPRHPPWLNRTSYELLLGGIPPYTPGTPHVEGDVGEYILQSIETIRTEAERILEEQPSAGNDTSSTAAGGQGQGQSTGSEANTSLQTENLERVWFWFPMLSTREKRKDLIDYAPGYGLTGFVIAGKPALLCLEGNGREVERYMSDIKSISWSDIPSYQKKVWSCWSHDVACASGVARRWV